LRTSKLSLKLKINLTIILYNFQKLRHDVLSFIFHIMQNIVSYFFESRVLLSRPDRSVSVV